jgi:mRNA interferase MazF
MVEADGYIPKRGDVVRLTLTPQVGHEQAGRRPVLVLSPEGYNKKVGLALFCPLTNQSKGYPFEVLVPSDLPVSGVILADQVKSFDWRGRRAEWICTLPTKIVAEVIQKLRVLLEQ